MIFIIKRIFNYILNIIIGSGSRENLKKGKTEEHPYSLSSGPYALVHKAMRIKQVYGGGFGARSAGLSPLVIPGVRVQGCGLGCGFQKPMNP